MHASDRQFIAVVAVDIAWCIGRDNQIPWHLPDDLKHFKQITTGQVIVMGRKTHESIGRALPGRRNIVLSRQADYKAAEGGEVVRGRDELFELLADETREVCVIGGTAIYEMLMPWTSRCVLTVVDVQVEGGDAFLPALAQGAWRVVSSQQHASDARHAHAFIVHDLERVEEAWADPELQPVPASWRA